MPGISGMSGIGSQPIQFSPGFIPSMQQLKIGEFVVYGQGNAIVVAVAGAGKTTTLVEICRLISGYAAFMAFNAAIAKDIERKLGLKGIDTRRIQASTFHSRGLSLWKQVAPNVNPRGLEPGQKMDKIMWELDVPKSLRPFVLKLVSYAKQDCIGVPGVCALDDRDAWMNLVDHHSLRDVLILESEYGDELDPEEVLEQGLAWSVRALRASNAKGQEWADFDDMLYLPLVFDVKPKWLFDWLLLDEAQDTNRARRLLAAKLLKKTGRLIAVGDPCQGIYGFTGASADALEQIKQMFNCIELPLTITYRCPKAVVRHAHQWVNHIEAADSAPEGIVREIKVEEFYKVPLKAGEAVLCRNTKPLVQLAFDLIRRRIPCHVEGREIGKGLIALARKWKSIREIGDLREKLRDWGEEEVSKLQMRGKEMQAENLMDRISTLFVLMQELADDDSIDLLEQSVKDLFQDTDGTAKRTVILSTIHKAKGREWETVYLLGRNRYQPSPFAKQEWELVQETNLIYVAVTRAMRELVEVTMPSKRMMSVAGA